MEKRQQSVQFDYRTFLEESAEDLYENATCGYLSCLMDGTIVKVNRTLLSWLHYSPQEILRTKSFDSLLVIGSRIYYETHFAPLLHMQGFINEISLELLRKDRSYLPVLVNAVQVKAPDGKPVVHRYTLINITDRHLYEQELLFAKRKAEQLNQELAAVNEELAAASEEIQASNEELVTNNEELSMVNQQLEKVNAELDNFIYTASHDLKAPISNIEGLLRMLLKRMPAETLLDERTRKLTDLMQDSVERFKQTISHLTEVVKLQKESNQALSAVDLAKVVREVRLDLTPQLEGVKAVLDVAVDACPSIHFSEKNLRSVVYNLLSNAVKYASPERVPLVRIHCHLQGTFIVLSVSDNGLGLDAAQQTKLFTMFGRLHNHVEGSGVGLYMIKKMVENAGGRIEVASQPGVGSTFRVYFPV